MKNDTAAIAPMDQRIIAELKEFPIIAAYLYICFSAPACLRAATLQAHRGEV